MNNCHTAKDIYRIARKVRLLLLATLGAMAVSVLWLFYTLL
jgi:hypothetical protein